MDRNKDLSVVSLSDPYNKRSVQLQKVLLTYIESRKKLIIVKKETFILYEKTKNDLK